jgi:hypothetical protein
MSTCRNCGSEIAEKIGHRISNCSRCGYPVSTTTSLSRRNRTTALSIALFVLLLLFLSFLLFSSAGGGIGWARGTVFGSRFFGSSGKGTGAQRANSDNAPGTAVPASSSTASAEQSGGAPEIGSAEDRGTATPLRGRTNSLAGSGSPRPANENGATITAPSFAGVQGRGTRFVYVIDRSSSMSGGRLRAAQAELISSLQQLRTNMAFMIIFYNTRMLPMPSGWLPASPRDVARAGTWVRNMRAEGGTDPEDAMVTALRMRPDTIWLLSDGDFSVNAVDTVRLANPGHRVMINTIAFHDSSGEQTLKRIAAENGGSYRFVPP